MFSQYLAIAIIGFSAILFFYLFTLLFQKKAFFKKILKKHFGKIKLFLFVFYLLVAFFLKGEVNDVALFSSVGYCLWHKIDIYWLDATHGTYPFLPFTIYPYALFWFVSDKLPFLTFSFLVKTVLIPIFFLTASLIGKFLKKQGVEKNKIKLAKLLFLTNPVLFWAVVFHGQADIALIYFFILSIYHLKNGLRKQPARDHPWSKGIAGLLMAFSIMTKSWSIMFLPLVLLKIKSLKKKLIYFSTFFLTIFLFASLYKLFVFSSFSRIFKAALFHPTGAAGHWGITALFHLSSKILPLNSLISFYSKKRALILSLALLTGFVFSIKKKLALLKGAQLFILIVYIFTAGWGIQYSAWIIPFALVNKDWQKNIRYTLLAIPYLSFSYLAIAGGWQNPFINRLIIFLGLFPWVYSGCWLLKIRQVSFLKS